MIKRITTLLTALILTASCALAEEVVPGFTLNNVLRDPERGEIHYNLHVPDDYDGSNPVPLYIALPGW